MTITYYILNLGLEQAQYRLWSTGAAPRRSLPATGFTLGIGLGSFGAVCLFLVRTLSGDSFISEIPPSHMIIAVIALPFMVHGLLLVGLAILQGYINRMNLASLAAAVAQFLAIGILFQQDKLSVGRVLLIWTISAAIPWMLLLHSAAMTGPLFPPSGPVMRNQILLGLRYAPHILFAFLILRIDVLFLAEMRGFSSVGLYSVAVLFPEMVWVVTDSLMYPVSNRQANLPEDEAARVTSLAFRVVGLLAVSGGVLAAFIGHWLVPFAYGGEFSPATPVIWTLIPGIVGLALWRALNAYLLRTVNPWVQPAIGGAALLANVILNVALIPAWGIVGAAAASSIAYLVGACLAARTFLATADQRGQTLVPTSDDARVLWEFARSIWSTTLERVLPRG